MRGDYVRRSDLPVIPTKAMVPLGDLQTIDGVDRARLLRTTSAREARNHGVESECGAVACAGRSMSLPRGRSTGLADRCRISLAFLASSMMPGVISIWKSRPSILRRRQ